MRTAFAIVIVVNVFAASAGPLSVKSCGAIGNGIVDDTAAIQQCINLARSLGLPLEFPSGSYLLNTYYPSTFFGSFYNLIVGSNSRLIGSINARLIQGTNGCHAPCNSSENAAVVIGTPNYRVDTFQNAAYNGGFYDLLATNANDNTIALATAAEGVNFTADDFIAIYNSTCVKTQSCDVIPAETSQIAFVSGGVLTLKYRLARSFSVSASPPDNPVVAKVTANATVNVSLENVTIQGATPLIIQEAFDVRTRGVTLIADASKTSEGMSAQTIRGWSSVGDTFTSINGLVNWELPQRDSQDISFDRAAFTGLNVGAGEYGAHWSFTNSKFWLTPNPGAALAINLGFWDVVFAYNHVSSGLINANGAAYIFDADYGPTASYVGHVRIIGNDIEVMPNGGAAIQLASADPVVSSNHIVGSGILLQTSQQQCAVIKGNSISAPFLAGSRGIILTQGSPDCSVIVNNSIVGSSGAGAIGIHVYPQASPSVGYLTITGNNAIGFKSTVDIDLAFHPGALIVDPGRVHFPTAPN